MCCALVTHHSRLVQGAALLDTAPSSVACFLQGGALLLELLPSVAGAQPVPSSAQPVPSRCPSQPGGAPQGRLTHPSSSSPAPAVPPHRPPRAHPTASPSAAPSPSTFTLNLHSHHPRRPRHPHPRHPHLHPCASAAAAPQAIGAPLFAVGVGLPIALGSAQLVEKVNSKGQP